MLYSVNAVFSYACVFVFVRLGVPWWRLWVCSLQRTLNACVICVSWVCVCVYRGSGVGVKYSPVMMCFFSPIHGFQSKDLHEALISD